MRTIRFRAALAVVAAGALTLGAVSTATAAPLPNAPFGGWGKCPIANPETSTCVDVVVKGGEMNINGLKVPIPSGSLNIAGGVAYRENPDAEFGFDQIFIPPTDGTKGVYSSPIEVPGGIFGLGIPFPGGLTTIKATVEPVALPTVDAFQLGVTLPARLKISNPCWAATAIWVLRATRSCSNSEFPKMVSWRKFQDFRIPPPSET